MKVPEGLETRRVRMHAIRDFAVCTREAGTPENLSSLMKPVKIRRPIRGLEIPGGGFSLGAEDP